MATRHIIAVAALLSTGVADAAKPTGPRWMAVGAHVDGSTIEVNAAAIVTVRGLTRGWWRLRLMQPRPDGTAIEAQMLAVDCARRLATVLETIDTRLDGSLVADLRESESAALTRLSPATPGTSGETAARAICQLQPGRHRR